MPVVAVVGISVSVRVSVGEVSVRVGTALTLRSSYLGWFRPLPTSVPVVAVVGVSVSVIIAVGISVSVGAGATFSFLCSTFVGGHCGHSLLIGRPLPASVPVVVVGISVSVIAAVRVVSVRVGATHALFFAIIGIDQTGQNKDKHRSDDPHDDR